MTRGQWTLAGLLIVQIVLIVVLHSPGTSAAPAPHPLVPELDTSTVTRIEVTSKSEGPLTLEKQAGTWEIATADGYPADGAKVSEVLSKIRDASVGSPVVTSDKYHESLEVSEDTAQARIKVYGSDEKQPEVDLIVGSTTTGGAHVRLAGDEDVYDIRDFSPWEVRPDTTTWMQRKLVDLPKETVTRLRVSNENGAFEIEKNDAKWTVSAPVESKGSSCLTDKVDPILRAVTSLDVAGAAGQLDPVAQGLDDDATVATISWQGGSITVRIGDAVPEESSKVYITRDGFGFAATQWASSLDSVKNANLADLLE